MVNDQMPQQQTPMGCAPEERRSLRTPQDQRRYDLRLVTDSRRPSRRCGAVFPHKDIAANTTIMNTHNSHWSPLSKVRGCSVCHGSFDLPGICPWIRQTCDRASTCSIPLRGRRADPPEAYVRMRKSRNNRVKKTELHAVMSRTFSERAGMGCGTCDAPVVSRRSAGSAYPHHLPANMT